MDFKLLKAKIRWHLTRKARARQLGEFVLDHKAMLEYKKLELDRQMDKGDPDTKEIDAQLKLLGEIMKRAGLTVMLLMLLIGNGWAITKVYKFPTKTPVAVADASDLANCWLTNGGSGPATGNWDLGTYRLTAGNITDNGLTALEAVVTDASKNLISYPYTYVNTGNTLVQRDSAGNAAFNNFVGTVTQISSAGQTIAMTYGSSRGQEIYGTQNVTFKLPDSTYLYQGEEYHFNNNSTGTIIVYLHDGVTLVGTVPSMSYAFAVCDNNTTVNGEWDIHYLLPSTNSYVPYTGATSDVNLGTHNLTTTGYIEANAGFLSKGTTTGFTIPSGAGTRMMWIPDKYAFRAGVVTGTDWDAANIGIGSFAVGTDNIVGQYGTAFGDSNQVGVGAFAAGEDNIASGQTSVTMGYGNHALGDYSVALGQQNNSRRYSDVTIGFQNDTGAGNSGGVLIGQGNIITPNSGANGNAFGIYNVLGGTATTSIGAINYSIGNYTTTIGLSAIANNDNSFVMGNDQSGSTYLNDSNAPGGLTLGGYNPTSGIGENWLTIIPGTNADSPLVQIGNLNNDSGVGALTINVPTGSWDTTSTLQVNGVATVGNVNIIGDSSYDILIGNVVVGGTYCAGGQAIAIGYGAYSDGQYAVSIGGANATVEYAIAIGSGAYATGDTSSALGAFTNAYGIGSTAIGSYCETDGDYSLVLGAGSYATNNNSIVIGTNVAFDNNLNDSDAIGGLTLGGYNPTAATGQNWFCIYPVASSATLNHIRFLNLPTQANLASLNAGDIYKDTTGGLNILKVK